MTKNLSFDEAKKLFIQKAQAIQFLDELRQQYPELFDKRFLYEMLKHELDLQSMELPQSVEKLLIDAVNKKGH